MQELDLIYNAKEKISKILNEQPEIALDIKKQISQSHVGASTDLMTYIGASQKQKNLIRQLIDDFGNTVTFGVLNSLFPDHLHWNN